MTHGTVLFDITENGKNNARNGIAADEFLIGSWRNCQSQDVTTLSIPAEDQ